MFIRAIAIMAPGMFLSHPPTASTPSMLCARQAVSMASAMTSRDTSEYFIPSVPIEMPSLTVMVPNICGIPPPAVMADSARRASTSSPALHGRDRAVAVGDAHDGLGKVTVAEPERAQHRAIRRALVTLGDGLAVLVERHGVALGVGERLASAGKIRPRHPARQGAGDRGRAATAS